jgi:phosphoheptose isomerase
LQNITEAINRIVTCIKAGNKVLTFGVGGNAANAIHFAAELAGKYEKYEKPLPCIDLCSNVSILTAITNDFGWEHVFERQIQALGRPDDIVLAFSISTKATYLQKALDAAFNAGCKVILICGQYTEIPYCNHSERKLGDYKAMIELVELSSLDTPRVQEAQLVLIHRICEGVKSALT